MYIRLSKYRYIETKNIPGRILGYEPLYVDKRKPFYCVCLPKMTKQRKGNMARLIGYPNKLYLREGWFVMNSGAPVTVSTRSHLKVEGTIHFVLLCAKNTGQIFRHFDFSSCLQK